MLAIRIPRRHRPMCPVPDWKPGHPKFWTLNQKAKFDAPFDRPEVKLIRDADYLYTREIERKASAYQSAYNAYLGSIEDGIALEVARSVLPVGIYSSAWVTVNPRSLMAFLSLRTHDEDATYVSYPQAEIEEAARATEAILKAG